MRVSYKPLLDKRAGFVAERNKLSDGAVGEGRALNKDEQKAFKELTAEIQRMDELITQARSMDDTGLQNLGAPIPDFDRIERGQSASWGPSGYRTEHRSLGEFIHAIRYEKRDLSMGVGAGGGFLVPDQLLPQILTIDPGEYPLTARATPIGPNVGAPDAATEIPALDVSGANGALGGVTVTWIAEAANKPQTEPAFALVKLEPQEVAGHVVVSDKLLRNAPEASAFLGRVLRAALAGAMEQAFLTGTGLGQPLGIVGHPACVNIGRTAPVAIAYADLIAMVGRFGPSAWNGGFWLASQTALPALLGMVDPGAAGTLLIRPSEIQAGKPLSLLGLPLIISTRTPPLGSQGDLMLLNASFYLKKLGSGPFVEASPHPRFVSNQTIVKIYGNVDGEPWLTSPVLSEDAVTTLSPFVVLQ